MRKLFSSRRRFIGLGLMSALVIALAVLGALWGFSQGVSANGPSVGLVHVEPDGSDYTGNPYCPDTIWTGTLKPVVNPWHDCNNITSQNHVIRTDDWVETYRVIKWNIENFSGAVATNQAQGRCGDIPEVTSRPNWDDGYCRDTKDNDVDTRVNDGCPQVGVIPENVEVIDGGVDVTGDTVVEEDDDMALLAGKEIIGGSVDIDDSGEVDEDDDGTWAGVPVINGGVDIALPAGIDEDDDGNLNGLCVNATDDDGDTIVNDGCPAVGPSEDINDQQCLVIHSSTPGETRVTLNYSDGAGGILFTKPVVKEWDSLVDSVILKYGDVVSTGVKVYYDADGDGTVETSEYKLVLLPLDQNGDTKRDQLDEHLLDKQGAWQDHPVVFDESLKRLKSAPPVQLIEVVHGGHDVLINNVSVHVHQPTQGALVLAEIETPRYCTFFTNSLGTADYGSVLPQAGEAPQTFRTDNLGRAVYRGEYVYVDTVCEEQAKIHFYVQYPNQPGSLRLGLHEWVGINWTTVEQAKQPQIRWAGEEIILAKRWALPEEWFNNIKPAPLTGFQDYCPLATQGGAEYYDMDDDDGDLADMVVTHHVEYTLDSPGLGTLKGGYIDKNGDGRLDTLSSKGASEARGDIDNWCISRALADSEDPGQQNIEALLMRDTYYCPPLASSPNDLVAAAGVQATPLLISWNSIKGLWGCYSVIVPTVGPPIYTYEGPADLLQSVLENKHAFLVWYLKIYQVKLTNVDGERADHNAGAWTAGKGADTEAESLNVSQDTLLRVKVKGWLFTANLSGRGAVCIDMDGDGNGKTGTDATEPGVPYPVTNEDVGCTDSGDEMLENGHWVLPDDLPLLAGPDAIHTRPNWDVMSEATASKTTAIGPKSTLDSHDSILRPWLDRKTVVPDGAITAADAIMPPLKVRASIADNKDTTVDDGESGFLKEALKGVIYSGINDYHSSYWPADREIPAMVNNGGYDWMTYDMPSCPDIDGDGVCNTVDTCTGSTHFDPTNLDTDGDTVGDACDDDTDGDTILDDGDASGVIGPVYCVDGDITLCDDNCRFNKNATQADVDKDGVGTACDADDADATKGRDSDGDTVLDSTDNCDTKTNDTQLDTDGDGYGDACDANPGLHYNARAPIQYPFWAILYKLEREDKSETVAALKKRPWYIEFYTDNRGEGMFFANGDFNLKYGDCRKDPVSGAPDCSNVRPDVVGSSKITVIGDYPYFRKHPAVLSNPVVKTWEWGGFKDVESVRIDANHIAIIAHLLDRDGYCKYAVGSNPTAAGGVTTSPSLHPVQGEAIEFILNTDVGRIIEVSPNGVYEPPAPHDPLTKARVVRLEDGVLIDRSEAVALAEDGRVLDYFDEARGIDEGLVAKEDCQAWIVVEHPLGEEPNVSVRFHDPEGVILRHWPPSELIVTLVEGWNDSCYAGPTGDIKNILTDAKIVDDVLAVYLYNATDTADPWKRWLPGRTDNDLAEIKPYDQLFILMAANAEWAQLIQAMPTSVKLEGASATDGVPGAWNSVCYAGADKATGEAVRDIEGGLVIMYKLATDQTWRRYIPGRDEIPDTLTTLHRFDSVLLLITTEGGVTWKFDA